MKNLLSILFLTAAMSVSCQDRSIELQEKLDDIMILYNDLLNNYDSLANENTKLLDTVSYQGFFIDSLRLVIEDSGTFPDSLLADSLHFSVYDSYGNEIRINKDGQQMNTMTLSGSTRLTTFMQFENRYVYFMDGLVTGLSVLEDSSYYYVNEDKLTIKKEK